MLYNENYRKSERLKVEKSSFYKKRVGKGSEFQNISGEVGVLILIADAVRIIGLQISMLILLFCCVVHKNVAHIGNCGKCLLQTVVDP